MIGYRSVHIGSLVYLIIFLSVLFAITSLTWTGFRLRSVELAEQAEENLVHDMTALQREIAAAMQTGDQGLAESALTTRGIDLRYRYILAANENHEILFSTRFAWKGKSLDKALSDYRIKLPAPGLAGRRPTIESDASERLLWGFFPLDLPIQAGEIRSYRTGLLVAVYDLSIAEEQIGHGIFQAFVPMVGCFLVVTLMIGFVVRRYVIQPIRHLSFIAERIRNQDYASRSNIQGYGELSSLSRIINSMAAELEHQDIQNRRMTAEIQTREQGYRALAENSSDVIIRFAKPFEIVYANPAAERLLGDKIDEAELLTPSGEQLPAELLTFLHHSLNIVLSNEKALSQVFTWPSMNKLVQDWRFVPEHDSEGNLQSVLAVARDVTDVIQSEEKRDQLLAAIEQLSELVLVTDLAGNVTYANSVAETFIGIDREAILSSNLGRIDAPVGISGALAEMWNILRKHQNWSGRVALVPDGANILSLEIGSSAVTGHDGKHANYVVVGRDVSAELRLGAELRHAQKMESVGTLAGGIAHDFNNIIGVIQGNAEFLESQLGPDHPEMECVADILDASERGSRLVSQIMMFSRKETPNRELTSIEGSVLRAERMLRSVLPASVSLHFDIGSNIPQIIANQDQICQVVVNLCTNAWHASGEFSGEIKVSLHSVSVGNEEAARHVNLRPGAYLVLEVADNGIGMDEETLGRIFDPFFTTKGPDTGTGLGLSVVHGIVENHDGVVLVTSQPQVGTKVEVFFPVLGDESTELPEHSDSVDPLAGAHRKRILYVDDEKALVRAIKLSLENLGQSCMGLTSAEEALEHLRADPSSFDLAIIDFRMPGMTGLQLAREIAEIQPDLPLVLCSGFLSDMIVHEGRQLGISEFLRKPITRKDLIELLGRLSSHSEVSNEAETVDSMNAQDLVTENHRQNV